MGGVHIESFLECRWLYDRTPSTGDPIDRHPSPNLVYRAWWRLPVDGVARRSGTMVFKGPHTLVLGKASSCFGPAVTLRIPRPPTENQPTVLAPIRAGLRRGTETYLCGAAKAQTAQPMAPGDFDHRSSTALVCEPPRNKHRKQEGFSKFPSASRKATPS